MTDFDTPCEHDDRGEPVGKNSIMVEIQGVYDGALFWMCDVCKHTWHRFGPRTDASYLRMKAQQIMERWERKRRGETEDQAGQGVLPAGPGGLPGEDAAADVPPAPPGGAH